MSRMEDVFNARVKEYEEWFEQHPYVYATEVELLRRLLPNNGMGIEIGVGTGRFAGPLGIEVGIDLSEEMLALAKKRGIEAIWADAHNLPFEDESFDYALMMVTLCFVEDPDQAIKEACRVLKKGGVLVIGIVDKESPLGQVYQRKRKNSPFYKYAHFFSVDEVKNMLKHNGFNVKQILQTLFVDDLRKVGKIDEVKDGYGQGGFVGIKALKL